MLCSISISSTADNTIIRRLDDAIANRPLFQKAKEHRIDSLKELARAQASQLDQLETYNRLFQEYLTYNFDSAMAYVDLAEKISLLSSSYDVMSQVEIHRALSLATSGHFSNAIAILDKIDSKKLSTKMLDEYYSACVWTYGAWAEYADKRTVAPDLATRSRMYLDSLISVSAPGTPEYTYRIAEKALHSGDFSTAADNYNRVLKHVPVDSRLYAQSAFALATTYSALGNAEKYKEWMVNAAISDIKAALKENLALQQLAMYLNSEEGDLERANFYLKIALEDAVFYNNRLRMLEIAEKIPDIVNAYQDKIKQQNSRLKFYILIIGILVVLLGGVTLYVYRQHRKISRSKNSLAQLNDKLRVLNLQLAQTNQSRERYVSLFMDLCAAYIDKLNRFPIVLKVKVKQLGDVSSVADRYVKPSETETREMFFNFDTAFLRLYPDFITSFNALLKPDKQVAPKTGELLNTDLRIYALVRMGISDSNKIATLLFLSPQTIFNHRTQVRNRARNRESFERDVLDICSLAID